MPVVSFPVGRFNQLLGKTYSQDELVEALEQLGCDVEDTVELLVYECARCGTPNEKLPHEAAPRRCEFCGFESPEGFPVISREQVIRLDLLAARPDLFDAGGLTRALRGFLGLQTGCPEYQLGASDWVITVDPELTQSRSYRPYIMGAIVTAPPLDRDGLREIMNLQETLHWGIGRDRKLTAIGVHDFDTIQPPLSYLAHDPDCFTFEPLGMPGQFLTLRRILETHPKGIAYAHLLKDHHKYPMLIDAKGMVLSMPPIINGEDTKLKIGARRFFIDVTGVAPEPVNNTLKTLVSSLIELGGVAQTVTVVDAWGRKLTTPDLSPQTIAINSDAASRWLGIPLPPQTLTTTLERMRFSVTGTGPDFSVAFPAFRTDIKHEVDVFEDLAIGYGYQNIQPALIKTMTIGKERPEELLSNQVRQIMTGLGYAEIMSLTMCSVENHFAMFNLEPGEQHVVIANAKTKDQGTVRSHLMLGVMETLRVNRRRTPPITIFELGNVLVRDQSAITGVREERHVTFAVMGPEAGYAETRAILDAMLREFGWSARYEPFDHPSFIAGRCARVLIDEQPRAVIGEVHPQVLNNFGLPLPAALCELNLMRVI